MNNSKNSHYSNNESQRDEEEFEAWYNLPADQTLNDPKLYRQFLDDTLPDHTKTFCEKAWFAALASERARSKVLIEALEIIETL